MASAEEVFGAMASAMRSMADEMVEDGVQAPVSGQDAFNHVITPLLSDARDAALRLEWGTWFEIIQVLDPAVLLNVWPDEGSEADGARLMCRPAGHAPDSPITIDAYPIGGMASPATVPVELKDLHPMGAFAVLRQRLRFALLGLWDDRTVAPRREGSEGAGAGDAAVE